MARGLFLKQAKRVTYLSVTSYVNRNIANGKFNWADYTVANQQIIYDHKLQLKSKTDQNIV